MTPVDPQPTSPSDSATADSTVGSLLSPLPESSGLESADVAFGVDSRLAESPAVEATPDSPDWSENATGELSEAAGAEVAIAQGTTAVAVKEAPNPSPNDASESESPEPKTPKLEITALSQRLQKTVKATAQTSLRRLKHRPTQLVLLGAVATFALGGATSYLLRRPANGPSSLESAVALVPNTAVASLTLNPKSEPWQDLRQLGTPNLQQGLGEWLAVGRDRVVNLGYGDLSVIQQQLDGPPVIALVPVAPITQPLPGQPPQAVASDVLLVAPLKSPKAVARSLDERQPPEGFDNSTSSYRGVKVWDLQVDLVQRQSVAIFGSFGLLASNRTTLERAIDSYQEGTALGDLNEYEDAQRRLGVADLNSADGTLMSFYINGPAAVLSNQAAGRLLPLPAELQGLVGQVRVSDGDDLDLNTVTWDKTAEGLGVLAQPAPSLVDKPKAMVALGDRFPASTSFLLSGSSLQEAWRSFSQGPASGNALLSPSALQEQVQAVTSMDLQKDWLSWMDGPYSVGILPIPTQANSRFQTGLTVMAQTSNRRLAERSLQKLDALMVNKYGLRLSTSNLDGQPVVNWANAKGEAVVTHGWLEGNIAFLIVGAPGANLLLPQPRATLAASRLYREGMPRAASQDPAGVLFVDVDRVLDTQLPSLLPLTPSSRPVLEQLKSIGVERRPLDERFSRYDLSLKFLSRSAAPPVEEPAPEESNPESSSPEAEATAPDLKSAEPDALTEPEADTGRLPQPIQESSEPSAVLETPQQGPVVPETLPAFGPVFQAEPTDGTESAANALNDSARDAATTDIAETTNLAEEAMPEEPLQQPVQEDVIIDPRTAISVGPPTPSRDFDFTPIGPKFPRPESQKWSDDFIQSPAE